MPKEGPEPWGPKKQPLLLLVVWLPPEPEPGCPERQALARPPLVAPLVRVLLLEGPLPQALLLLRELLVGLPPLAPEAPTGPGPFACAPRP